MSRQRTAQRPPAPGLDLTTFPVRVLPAGRELWRCGEPGHPSPWHYASRPPATPGGDGRFDLPRPAGTCYVALDPVTAVLEYIGPEWASGVVLDAAFLTRRHLYKHTLRAPLHLANLTSERVTRFRVTRELATMADYQTPQQWAAALAGVDPGRRFDGIVYPPRFHVSPNARSVALFGPRAELEVDADEEISADLLATLAGLGVTLLDGPALARGMRGGPPAISAVQGRGS